MWRRLRKCIIDPQKLAIDVAKFSACFCHQSIDHPVCKSLVGTYDGGYFSVEKNSLRLQLSRERALQSVNFGAALHESDAYPEQFHTEKSKFTTLVGFTVVCSYRISLGNTKDEGLKELWCDLSSKNNFLNQ